MSAVIDPTTRFATGAMATRYLSAITLAAGSTLAGSRRKLPAASFWKLPSGFWMPFTAMVLCASAETNRLVWVSIVMEMDVTRRPNDPALVTTELAPDEFGSAQL